MIDVEDELVVEAKAVDEIVDVRTKGRDSLPCVDVRRDAAERYNLSTSIALR